MTCVAPCVSCMVPRLSPPVSYMSPMSSPPWLTPCPCPTLRCHMHVSHVQVPTACSWKGLMSPRMFPRSVPYLPPMSHASPVATSVPPPCPEVPHGCHRCIRTVSVSPCGSLVWDFHGEVAQGLVIEGPKRQVWGLRGVPKEDGGACLVGGESGGELGPRVVLEGSGSSRGSPRRGLSLGGLGLVWGPRGRFEFGRVWGAPLSSHCHCVPPGMHLLP